MLVVKDKFDKILIDGVELSDGQFIGYSDDIPDSIRIGKTFTKEDYCELNEEDKQTYKMFCQLRYVDYRYSPMYASILFINSNREFQRVLLDMGKIKIEPRYEYDAEIEYAITNRYFIDNLAECYATMLIYSAIADAKSSGGPYRYKERMLKREQCSKCIPGLRKILIENTPIHLMRVISANDQEKLQMRIDIETFKQKREKEQKQQAEREWNLIVMMTAFFMFSLIIRDVVVLGILALGMMFIILKHIKHRKNSIMDEEFEEKRKKWGAGWDE